MSETRAVRPRAGASQRPASRNVVPLVGSVLLAWAALVMIHPSWLPTILTGAG